MCEHCRNIQIWRKFDAPKDYLACIAYLKALPTLDIVQVQEIGMQSIEPTL